MKHRRLLALWLAVVLGAAVLAFAVIRHRGGATTGPTVAARPLPPGGDFSLATASGRFDLAAHRGQVVVLSFGYTACPDICPTTLTTIARALQALPPATRAAVVPVFVTVDPARDTVERLATYVGHFDPALLGAAGTTEELAAIARQYEVVYARVGTGPGYSIDHSAEIHVLDRVGRPAARLAHDAPPTELAAVLRTISGAPSAPVAQLAPPAAPPPAAAAGAALVVADPYVRLVPASSPNTAAFMRLHNPGPAARAVIGGRSPAAGRVELHTHLHDGGVMRMRQIERIEVPAGGDALLAPGGLHVMMFDLVRPLAAGDTVVLELDLDDGSRLELSAPVRAPEGAAPGAHAMGGMGAAGMRGPR